MRPEALASINPPPAQAPSTALVIGAGIAGCSLAWALAKRGWRVSLIEQQPQPAQGASGNPAALVRPVYRQDQGIDRWLSRCAWRATARLISTGKTSDQNLGIDYLKNGNKTADKTEKRQAGLIVDPVALCQQLLNHPNIDFLPEQRCERLHPQNGGYLAELTPAGSPSASFEIYGNIAIIAAGYQSRELKQAQHLPTEPVWGQLGIWHSQQHGLQRARFGKGYAIPLSPNELLIGALHRRNQTDPAIDPSDSADQALIHCANELGVPLPNDASPQQRRAAIRSSSFDRRPVLGPMPQWSVHAEVFADLARGFNLAHYQRLAGQRALYQAGLYVIDGLGGRGISTAPALAQRFAWALSEEGGFANRRLAACHPARGLWRALQGAKRQD